jgi:hypothetical protein
MTTFRALFAALVVVATFGLALAKLPAPPPMDDAAKAAAEQKKAKDAADANAGKLTQAKVEDRVAAKYIADQKAKGITVTPQMGPTAAAVAASIANGPVGIDKGGLSNKPPEKASNAHSDTKTVR